MALLQLCGKLKPDPPTVTEKQAIVGKVLDPNVNRIVFFIVRGTAQVFPVLLYPFLDIGNSTTAI